MTAAFLIAAFVCCLCNYVADGRFDWSLYVVGSEAAAWLMAAPLLKFRRHRSAAAMGGLTVSLLPLLLLIESLCPAKNWVFPFALPIAAISLASLWVVVLLFRCFRGRLLSYIAFVLFLFGTVDNVIIHNFVAQLFFFARYGDAESSDSDCCRFVRICGADSSLLRGFPGASRKVETGG